MNFRTADDMGAVLAAQLTKRLGFGMWARLHLTGLHVEGKVTTMFLSARFIFPFGLYVLSFTFKMLD